MNKIRLTMRGLSFLFCAIFGGYHTFISGDSMSANVYISAMFIIIAMD